MQPGSNEQPRENYVPEGDCGICINNKKAPYLLITLLITLEISQLQSIVAKGNYAPRGRRRNVLPEHTHLQLPDEIHFRTGTHLQKSCRGKDSTETMILPGICSILKPFPSWTKGTHDTCLGRLARRACGNCEQPRALFLCPTELESRHGGRLCPAHLSRAHPRLPGVRGGISVTGLPQNELGTLQSTDAEQRSCIMGGSGPPPHLPRSPTWGPSPGTSL